MMPLTLEAADQLGEAGVSARVVSFHTVKPLDEELLASAFSELPRSSRPSRSTA